MNTRILTVSLLLAIASLFFGASQATADSLPKNPGQGDPFVLTFDENGNSTININGQGAMNNPGFLSAVADPNTGFVGALTYQLSGQVVAGIVNVYDPNGTLSDAISFYNGPDATGALIGYMAYYSFDNTGDLADVGPIAGWPGSPVFVVEQANGTFAWFSGGAPGVDNDYYGVSSAPEPASMTLLGIGIAGMAGYGWRKRKQKQAATA
jgi:PEP-CTERM motif